MTKPDSQESKYWKLMSELKQKIVDGTYQSGDKMPSENELAAVYQVSRHTVRKALAILEHEGYIYAVHGKGTFCSEMGRHTKTSRNIAVVTTYLSDYIFPSVIQGTMEQLSDRPYVMMDDFKGGYLITKYLLSLGHRKILGMFKADDRQGIERHRGYAKALQEYGVFYDPDRIIWFHTEDRAVKPFARLRAMAASGIKFDSVVCYNDQIAIKTIQTLSQLGIRVSEDVSVTGYDNSFLAENYQVGLTTIAHPHERLGEIAAKLLLDLMQEKTLSLADRQIVIEPELIERESCKPR